MLPTVIALAAVGTAAPPEPSVTLVVLDLVGIFVFAISGALVAVRKGLDLFAVLVLAGTTGLGGGFLRDVLIGATPPAARDVARLAGADAYRPGQRLIVLPG